MPQNHDSPTHGAPEGDEPETDHGDERDPTAPDHVTRADINEALDCLTAVADAADAITALATAFAASMQAKMGGSDASRTNPVGSPLRRR